MNFVVTLLAFDHAHRKYLLPRSTIPLHKIRGWQTTGQLHTVASSPGKKGNILVEHLGQITHGRGEVAIVVTITQAR